MHSVWPDMRQWRVYIDLDIIPRGLVLEKTLTSPFMTDSGGF